MNPTFLKRFGVLLATALLAATGCSSSDNKTTGGVTGTFVGTVTSSTGSAIAGVTVTPSPADGPAVVTDSKGQYTMPVVAGAHTLSFAGDNLQTATASASVDMGKTVTVDQVMQPSPLTVTVNLPAALKNGGPSGFNTTVTGITASVKMNGSDVSADGVTWSIKDYYGLTDPPDKAAAPSSTTGASTGFAIGDLETVREGANAWLNARYGTTGTEEEFEYIQAPERDQLLSFGVQQVRAMSFKVIARVTSGGLTSTGSAIVSPVTISNGGNTLPLGMMVVGNTAKADAYNWALTYLPTDAGAGATFGAPPAEVVLQGATTKNPTVVPTVGGVYQLTNAAETAAKPISFRISTYHGAGMSELDPGPDGLTCQTSTCHTSGSAHDLKPKFDEWRASAHGNFNFADPSATPMGLFKFGLSGGEGSHYSESCIGCHTVGYSKVPTADNKGFDDIMKAEGWTFPTPPDTFDPTFTNWNAMPASLKYRGGIQCEACHGPLNTTDHPSVAAIGYSLVPPSASMSAGVCLVCHDALSNHDKGPLWSASNHAKTEFVSEATVEENPTTFRSGSVSGVAHCGRCHSAEGFALYVQQQQGGGCAQEMGLTPAQASGYIRYRTPAAVPPATGGSVCTAITDATTATAANTYFAGLGLTDANSHSQTCQTCHDPHSTELRVDGDTKVLAGQFQLQNAGAGALCMVCHNSRSDAVKQGDYTFAASTNLARFSPHVATQGDMFAGRNAFFMPGLTASDGPTNLPYLSAHAFMADTCVDCHVKWVPPDIQAQFTPAGTNHTFRTSTQVCAECHAADIGERIQESVTDKMATLQDAIGKVLSAKLLQTAGFDTTKGARKDPSDTSKTLTDPASLTVLPADVRSIVARSNASAVVVALNDGTSFYVGLDKIDTAGTGGATTPTSLFTISDANTQTLLKAYFNLLFVNNDGAKGIHNPAFAAAALDNATAALSTVTLP